MQYYQSTEIQQLNAYFGVPRTEYLSHAVTLHELVESLPAGYLFTASELVGDAVYRAVLQDYGVLFEWLIDDMIEKGYVNLCRYQRDQTSLYALGPHAERWCSESDGDIPDTPLNRLLLDIE
mgnify:CR=1 FL=1